MCQPMLCTGFCAFSCSPDCPVATLSAGPALTEFMAANDTVINDEDGDASDWIEIRNDGPVAVDLAGWHLTDDATLPTKWTFPTPLLDPGAHLIVFASDRDRRMTGSELHTDFRRSSAGEHLALMMPDGVTPATAFSPVYPPNLSIYPNPTALSGRGCA